MVVTPAKDRRGRRAASRSAAGTSRAAALAILAAVVDGGRTLEEAVDAVLAGGQLEARDRAFARSIATTAIRRLGQIDEAIGRLTQSGKALRPEALMHVLRLGAAQLLFLRAPPHAAVATSVDLADSLGLGRGKGLVNAVLRRLAREGDTILAEQDAARLNTPDWLWRRWVGAYGEPAVRAIVDQHLREPPLDFTLKPSEDANVWADVLDARLLPTGALRRPIGGRIDELPGFDQGAWWVQDVAASLPARLFGDVSNRKMLDLCAAPGGKTAQLAASGAFVTAIDRSPRRLKLVESNLARLRLAADLITADALAWTPPSDANYDAILLDAPCTATGTIRRHPDIALTKRQQDLTQLTALQAALLDRAWRWLKPGGTLVYCTCSLEPEEGEHQIARLLRACPDLRREPIRAHEFTAPEGAITETGDMRTLPSHLADLGGMDGFFAARLVRTT
jgi:16S rRNA (cytosine967-C5)-methyltransferase